MKRIQTLDTRDLAQSAKNGGCGECQTSCQSACRHFLRCCQPAVREVQREPLRASALIA